MAVTVAYLADASTRFSAKEGKVRFFTVTAVDDATGGTIPIPGMETVLGCVISGTFTFTAAPTYAGNVITIAFADPGAGGALGWGIAYGV